MGITNFPNGISSFGIPQIGSGIGLAGTQGNVFHVKPSSGSNSNDGSSSDRAFKSLSYALGKATADQNDIVLMYQESNTSASTTDYQSVALNWNKSGVHLIGVGAAPMIGSRVRIAQTSTILTIEDLVTISANNCLIANIEIYQGVASSSATSPRALVVSGQRNKIVNCQISGIGDLSMDTAGATSLAVTGAENHFINCYIGLDTVLRTTSVSEMTISGSATRTIFDTCISNSYCASAATTFKALAIAAGSYHTATWLRGCMLCCEFNRTGATAAQTGAILHSAAGNVFLFGGGVFGYLAVSTLDNANIIALTYVGAAGSSGANKIGIGTAIDTP